MKFVFSPDLCKANKSSKLEQNQIAANPKSIIGADRREALPHQFPPQPPEGFVNVPKGLLHPRRQVALEQTSVRHSLFGSSLRANVDQSPHVSLPLEARRLHLSFPLQVRRPPRLQSQFLCQGLQVQQVVVRGDIVPALFLQDTSSLHHDTRHRGRVHLHCGWSLESEDHDRCPVCVREGKESCSEEKMQRSLVDCDDPDHKNQEACADWTGTNGFHGNNITSVNIYTVLLHLSWLIWYWWGVDFIIKLTLKL